MRYRAVAFSRVYRYKDVIDIYHYIFHCLLLLIPTLLKILAITFAVIQLVPGGPVEQMMQQLTHDAVDDETTIVMAGDTTKHGNRISPEDLVVLNVLYGFDKSPLTRFVDMAWRFTRFDLGRSSFHHETVFELVKQKMPVSMSLGSWALFLTYLIYIPLGITKTIRDSSRFDVVTGMIVLVGYTIPPFVLGLVLLVLFGSGSFFAWFPQGGLVGDDFDTLSRTGKIKGYLWHMALPITASVAGSLAVTTVLAESVFLEEVRHQYVYIVRAKGLPEEQILWKHVFRNAMIPLITGFPAAFIGAFFADSLLIKTLFSLDGLGLLSYETAVRHDHPVVMGTLYVFTLVGLLARLASDISYSWVDPRIHFGGQK